MPNSLTKIKKGNVTNEIPEQAGHESVTQQINSSSAPGSKSKPVISSSEPGRKTETETQRDKLSIIYEAPELIGESESVSNHKISVDNLREYQQNFPQPIPNNRQNSDQKQPTNNNKNPQCGRVHIPKHIANEEFQNFETRKQNDPQRIDKSQIDYELWKEKKLRYRISRENMPYGTDILAKYEKQPKPTQDEDSDDMFPICRTQSLLLQWFYYFLNILINGMAFAFVIVILFFLIVSIYSNFNNLCSRNYYWYFFIKCCAFWAILYFIQITAACLLKRTWSSLGVFAGDVDDKSTQFTRLPRCTLPDYSAKFTDGKLLEDIEDTSGPHPALLVIDECYRKHDELVKVFQGAKEIQNENIKRMNRPRFRGEYILRGMCPKTESGMNTGRCC